ncbi:UDP-galactose transporter senju [Lycorma delicatula]|uniref:UDP-galactose transporter senju n=1 Tax=Lycorma delicatula TaxID=130591 RepID=UPI003F51346A
MFLRVNFSDLFPSKWSVIIFMTYMTLFVNQGLLVTASQRFDNAYNYNTVLAVLLTEVTKLFISVFLYCKDHPIFMLWKESANHLTVLWLYFVPAVLYCFYNNLSFVNLSVFDPTTYYLLLQLRVVITGIVFQIVFNRQLSRKQWISLIVLTIGCMLKQIHIPVPGKEVILSSQGHLNVNLLTEASVLNKETGIPFSINLFLILIQVVCSCLAGVYNEFLLKRQGVDCNIYIQNVFMYMNSIVCNLVLLLFSGSIEEIFTQTSINSILHYKVLLVILNNAAIGIVTSFFLRSLNSILKTFASALELVFTAILSWILFEIPIYPNTMLAIAVVSFAVIVYSQNPVVNTVTNPRELVFPKKDKAIYLPLLQ